MRNRIPLHLLATVVAGLLVAPAGQAILLEFTVDITLAAAGNPVGAVLGTGIAAGSGDTGTTDPTGVGDESISFQASASGTGAFLNLQIGNGSFDENMDIESVCCDEIPNARFTNGVFTGLDFVVLFENPGGILHAHQFDTSDLSQITDEFLENTHYWMDFTNNGRSFYVAKIIGFTVMEQEEELSLFPDLGPSLVEGTIAVPEPTTALLLLLGLAALGARRRGSFMRSPTASSSCRAPRG